MATRAESINETKVTEQKMVWIGLIFNEFDQPRKIMKRSWEIIAELLTANIKKVLASAFSVHNDTVGAWGRAPFSYDNPNGNGKHNPLDQAARYITIAHRYDQGNAHEAVKYLTDLIRRLDREAGFTAAESHNSPCKLLAESAKENTDIVVILAAEPENPQAWRRARTEISQAKAKLSELDGCLESLLTKTQTRKPK